MTVRELLKSLESQPLDATVLLSTDASLMATPRTVRFCWAKSTLACWFSERTTKVDADTVTAVVIQ